MKRIEITIDESGEVDVRVDGVRKVKPGEGYRLLEIGEAFLPDDEWFNDAHDEWVVRDLFISDRGHMTKDHLPYRRKLETPKEEPVLSPGDGYRWVEVGERTQSTDEIASCGYWLTYMHDGMVCNAPQLVRRKITNPPCGYGYRLLTEGEPILAGDESTLDGGKTWCLAHYRGAEYKFSDKMFFPHRRKIEAGEGWRLLDKYELLEESDEYLSASGTWESYLLAGCLLSGETIYRRKLQPEPAKVEPGEGYRLLENGEVINDDDECFREGQWEKTRNPGKSVGYGIFTNCVYRRKLPVYRLLNEGEVIQEGDEASVFGVFEWIKCHGDGIKVPTGWIVRRLITPWRP